MRRALALVLLLLACAALPAAAQVPPDGQWWSFDTEHFRVHFHGAELEPSARRAAFHGEEAHRRLREGFVEAPRGRIDLLVADNWDLANGFASSLPRNRIVVFLHPPVDQPTLSFFDDWLGMVVTHELTHIFHLEQAGGVWRPLRRVFGRTATLFPQHTTPGWVIEGLAVHFESRLTEAGRSRGTHFDMILRAASLEDRFFPIDRATGTPTTWPGGSGQYVYGALFVDHLAGRFGEDRVGAFVREVGGRLIPFRLDDAARRTFGVTFTSEWERWQDSLHTRYTALADSLRAEGLTEPEILTPLGRFASHPRIAPDGERIAFASSTLREEASTHLIERDGRQRAIAGRTTLDPLSWFPDGSALLTSERDFHGPYRIFADLQRVRTDGRRERITRGGRLREPDVHPDGRRAVAIAHAPGTNAPVVVEIATGEVRPLVAPAEGVHWTAPRWSPDGARIALARWGEGGFFDVVVLDTAGTVLRQVTRDRAIDTDPAWTPDGRHLLFASDRTGISNLYALDLATDSLFQVTNVLTGAFQPDVSPDGDWIVFSHYSAEGYHIARIPFDPASWRPAPPVRGALARAPVASEAAAARVGGQVRRYAPGGGLLPAGWLPQLMLEQSALGAGIGATVEGRDAVERHLWSTDLLVFPRGGRVDARAAYRFRGWGRPVLDLSAAQEWRVIAENLPIAFPGGDTVRTSFLGRERRAALQLRHSWPSWRSTWWVGGGPDARRFDRSFGDASLPASLIRPIPLDLGMRLFGGYSSARGYGFSISPEDGVQLQLSGEARRYASPFQGEETARGYGRLIGTGQGYRAVDWGGFARHVAAGRVAGGFETGSVGPGFSVGGVSGGTVDLAPGIGISGTQRTFGVRGYPAGTQRGDRAATATVEYRAPLALVERGVRAWPLFLDRVWGDLFLDAGTAWCERDCAARFLTAPRQPSPFLSVGAEAAAATVLGHGLGVILRGGVAFPLRDAGTGTSPQLYLVAGRSF